MVEGTVVVTASRDAVTLVAPVCETNSIAIIIAAANRNITDIASGKIVRHARQSPTHGLHLNIRMFMTREGS